MDKKNKDIIIREIETWRDSRLLPAEYCDFLSNLYAEGEFQTTEQPIERSRYEWKPSLDWKRISLALAGSAFLLLLVLHFTWFPNWMQIGLLLIGTFLFYFLAFRVPLQIRFLRPVFLTMASLLVAADGYYVVEKMGGLASVGWSLFAFISVLLVWILTGIAGESRMIVTVAWLGIGILYELALRYGRGLAFSSYGWNSAYWLVFAATSIGLTLFLGRTKLFTAPVWAVLGIVAIMVPDFLFIAAGVSPSFLIDVTAFLKISLIVTFVIVFREGIQDWLDSFAGTSYNKRK